MNWGIKITVVYLCFMGLIIGMVAISSNNKNELVAKDYYAQELKYQNRIDAIANEKQLSNSISYALQEDALILSYPPDEVRRGLSGEVIFFRPSDASKDYRAKLNFDKNGKQRIPKKLLTKGVYKLCITWKSTTTTYYKEEVINL